MHCVAAEVTQEVGVLLEHGDLDTRAGQHQSQEQSCRAATDDRACRCIAHVDIVARLPLEIAFLVVNPEKSQPGMLFRGVAARWTRKLNDLETRQRCEAAHSRGYIVSAITTRGLPHA